MNNLNYNEISNIKLDQINNIIRDEKERQRFCQEWEKKFGKPLKSNLNNNSDVINSDSDDEQNSVNVKNC